MKLGDLRKIVANLSMTDDAEVYVSYTPDRVHYDICKLTQLTHFQVKHDGSDASANEIMLEVMG